MDATELLRPGLLEGATIAVTGERCGAGLRSLGATTPLLAPAFPLDDDALAGAAGPRCGQVDAVVCDGRALFDATEGGLAGLRAAADGCFAAARAIVNAAFIPAQRGKVVLLAPADRSYRCRAGEHGAHAQHRMGAPRHRDHVRARARGHGCARRIPVLAGGRLHSGCAFG